ncbi:MAG: dihydrodipicolinate synthase family protein, partial [Puia sp.]
VNGEMVEKIFAGGLLGHWAVWTKKAVDLLKTVKNCMANDPRGVRDLLSVGISVTDMNAVIFDEKNKFQGCIPGIHEVLRRQGLLAGHWCLNPKEVLSADQSEEIDRICQSYPELTDDAFVRSFLAR